ncbi:hypothetical protein [Lactobacillus kullabergensis]|uniref:hypothetical protein n=1 Tax=Lactobacillus kullabergensis TaxID=1218493 RepID=UPI0012EB9D4B|nr:hypothetical protein [Lactobacillus kullabergensis]
MNPNSVYSSNNMLSGNTSLTEINLTGWRIKLSVDIFNCLNGAKVKINSFEKEDEDDN